jgi:hypothetical protein
MVIGSKRSRAHSQRISRGAVPLGQHSHSPDQVMPLPAAPVATTTAGVSGRLPSPAPTARGCACRLSPAALVDPTTNRAYCAGCWIVVMVQHQLD